MNLLGASWKTSLLGWLGLLGSVASFGKALLDGDPSTVPDFDTVLAALVSVGLLQARDNNVSSEKAGAK